MMSAERGDFNISCLLLEKGANLWLHDHRDRTAVWYAATYAPSSGLQHMLAEHQASALMQQGFLEEEKTVEGPAENA